LKKINNLEELALIKFDNLSENIIEDIEPIKKIQILEAHFSNKGRAGKTVTLIKGFIGSNIEIKALAKVIQIKINVGGSVKHGEILIQGDYRNQIIDFLISLGHKVKRVGG
tara:strand:+ start:5816 stop:6148 length:333 start_codon:yes stop_codon:yes gene_type:complete